MKPYEIIEHTADVGLKVYSPSLKELFENAARGMFEIIAGKYYGEKIDIQKSIHIKKEVDAFEELLVDWLSELLYIFNKEKILFRDFNVLELNYNGLSGIASGRSIDFRYANLRTEIKAVTFHNLKIEENEKGFSCGIIFDV